MKHKMGVITTAVVLLAVVSTALAAGCGPGVSGQSTTKSQPVIVIAAFGSSLDSGLKNLEDFDTLVRKEFPDHDVRWAFTAGFIIDKLKSAGVTTMFANKTPIKSLDQVYEDLRAEGKTNAVVQAAMIMPGAEMRQVLSYRTEGLNVKFGYPLLFSPENVQNVTAALASEFEGGNAANVLCSHGNEDHPDFNAPLLQMDQYLRDNFDNAYLATVEGPPGIDGVIEDIKASGVEKVRFVPLMMVEGDHITNDVMGDEPESWKTLIGLPATNATGIASNPEVMKLFVNNIRDLVGQF